MFAEFVVTYVPFAIAAVILVPVVLVHIAMFIDVVRTKQWKAAESRATRVATAASVSVPRRAAPRAQRERTFGSGLGLRHGLAARRDHD